jgi:16S rRNA (cytosine967-C5)-methyltransferase
MNARACAALVLTQVFAGRSLTEALKMPCVIASDAPFVQALCYGVLRHYPGYPMIVQALLDKPLKAADADIHALLQVGLFQLDGMRVPAHAAISESVHASRQMGKPWASGLVNALLRRYQREADALQAAMRGRPGFVHALPDWLLQRFRQAWPDQWQAIAAASQQQGPLCLRVNRQRMDRKDYFSLLQQQGFSARPHLFAPEALILDQAVAVERLPGFAEGLVSVQDAGAQLAAGLLAPRPGETLLDACAAPGGKSGHLLEITPGPLALTAIDQDAKRLQRVTDNLQRLGLQADCHAADVLRPCGDWAAGHYDKILLDAPCSATGVLRRHPDIKVLRRSDDIAALARTQQQALSALWKLLRPGGHLLYATCSILPEENALQMQAFLAKQSDAMEIAIDADWGMASGPGRQILPGEQDMDGFYYALVQKRNP